MIAYSYVYLGKVRPTDVSVVPSSDFFRLLEEDSVSGRCNIGKRFGDLIIEVTLVYGVCSTAV